MSTESSQVIGKAVIQTEVDGAGIESGISAGKRSLASLGTAAKAAGRDAAAGLAPIGTAAEASARQTEAAARKTEATAKRLAGDIQRQIALMQAGTRGSAEYYTALANQRGVDPKVLEPYLAQLRSVSEQQKTASAALSQGTGQLNTMGISARQTAAALRGVPAQFTDIFTSIQGGQAPLTVLLQQGGQLKDMFGGALPAARALGGYIVSLVSPLTVTAAAVAVLGASYLKGEAEAKKFAEVTVLSGNAAGVTADRLRLMAVGLSGISGTQGAAVQALVTIATQGKVAGDNLQRFTGVAQQLDRLVGKPVADTAKEFAALAGDPLQASLKLNEQYNFLTASVYSQIKALQDQGKETEAVALAQETFAGAMETRLPQLAANVGYVEQAWRGVTGAIKEALDAIASIGRADPLQIQISNVQAQLRQRSGQDANRRFTMPWEKSTGELEAELSDLRLRERLQARAAENAAAQALQVKAAAEFDRLAGKYKSDAVKLQEEINRIREQGRAGLKTELEVEQAIAAARAAANKGSKKTGGDEFASAREFAKAYADAYTDFAKLQADAEARTDGLSKAQARLVEYLTSPAYAEHSEAMREIVLQAGYAAITAEQEAEARKGATAAIRDAVKAHQALVDTQRKAADSVNEQVDRLRAEAAAVILAAEKNITLAQAIEAVTIARLQERQIAAMGNEDLVAQIQREIDARRALSIELGVKAAREKSLESTAAALKDQVRQLDDIDETARRVWTELGQGGVNAFERIGRTIKASVLDAIYQLTARPFVIQLAAQITGASGQAVSQVIGGSGNLLSAAGSLAGLAGGGYAGLVGSGVGAIFGQTAGNAALGAAMGLGTGSSAAAASAAAAAAGAPAAGAGLGATLGAAVPYIGLALAAASMLGVFDRKGGPKTEGGSDLAASVKAQYATIAQQLGVRDTSSFEAFYSKDPQGDSLTQLRLAAFSNGRNVFERLGEENVGRSEEEFGQAVRDATLRGVVEVLRDSDDLKAEYKAILDGITDSTSTDEIQRTLDVLGQRRALEAQLLTLTSTAAENLARAREAELEAMDPTLRALQRQIYAQQDLATAAQAATAAQSNLQRAADRERTSIQRVYEQAVAGIQPQIDSVTDSVQRLGGVAAALSSTISSYRTDSVTGIGRASATAQIAAAVAIARASGQIPKVEDLQDALAVIARPSESLFSTFGDYIRSRDAEAATLTELNELTEGQISVEQRTLDALKSQLRVAEDTRDRSLASLDELLAMAQRQIDALNGINVNLTLAQANAAFNAAAQQAGGPALGFYLGDTRAAAPDAAGLAFWNNYAAQHGVAAARAEFTRVVDHLTDGSHADGLWSVPRNGYIAKTHKGEAILPLPMANAWRAQVMGASNQATANLQSQIDEQKKKLGEMADDTRRSREVLEAVVMGSAAFTTTTG